MLVAVTAAALTAVSVMAVTAVPGIARAQAEATAAATPGCPPGVTLTIYCAPPQITATMEWTFFFTPKYTKVLSLAVHNAARATVIVRCKGRGCPYAQRSAYVSTTKPCGKKHTRRCRTFGSINLTRGLRRRHLAVGSKLSVAITRSGWFGKYYLFTVRAGHPPRIAIKCLAPGSTTPTGAC